MHDSRYSFFNLLLRKRSCVNFFYLLILINILGDQQLSAQQVNENAVELRKDNYLEEIYVRTDRDIYITGEQVWFKVYLMNGLSHLPSDISKVVYLELLDRNRFPVKQLKVSIDANSGSSVFTLPDNISSDNYVIRAYTSWMQNFTTELFSYKNISVINPFESIDHLKLTPENNSADSLQILKDWQSLVLKAEGGPLFVEKPGLRSGNNGINYTITVPKSEYSTREKVKIEITASDLAGNPVETDMSVSVAKSVIVNPTGINGLYTKDFTGSNEPAHEHLAELEGHLLTGYIRLKATDEPQKKTDLSLSYVGKTARCQFGKTDEYGEFNFLMKESGMKEIVIQPLSQDITGYYIELKQPFCDSFSKYIPEAFVLDSSKINEINNVIVAMQINNLYEPFRQKIKEESKTIIPDFYGQAENTIIMSDYIELTSVREVVKEIIPNVYTLKLNGKYDFKLINKFRGQPFENKPLVLVDGVPIYDFEKVLGINSKEIEKADVINTRYFYSENIFDGIVSFISRRGNLSVLEFDNSIFRQVYEACQVNTGFNAPDYSTDLLKNSHIPDFRNTLFWKPDLITSKNGKTEIEFFTSDESVEYTIVVEGNSSDGKKGSSAATLTVK
jgi:hypothetical protein